MTTPHHPYRDDDRPWVAAPAPRSSSPASSAEGRRPGRVYGRPSGPGEQEPDHADPGGRAADRQSDTGGRVYRSAHSAGWRLGEEPDYAEPTGGSVSGAAGARPREFDAAYESSVRVDESAHDRNYRERTPRHEETVESRYRRPAIHRALPAGDADGPQWAESGVTYELSVRAEDASAADRGYAEPPEPVARVYRSRPNGGYVEPDLEPVGGEAEASNWRPGRHALEAEPTLEARFDRAEHGAPPSRAAHRGENRGYEAPAPGRVYGAPTSGAGRVYGTPVSGAGRMYRAPTSGAGRGHEPVASGRVYGTPVSGAGRSEGAPAGREGDGRKAEARYGEGEGPRRPSGSRGLKGRRRAKTSGGTKVIGISLAVLVGLGVVGVALSLAERDAGGAVPTSENPSAAAAERRAVSSAPGLGTAVRDGKFEFVVKSVTCGKAKVGTKNLTKTAHGQFCLATVTVKNVGKVAQIFDASPQKLYNAYGKQYAADSGAVIYANENAQPFLEQIDPGSTVSGTLIFDLPKGQKLSALELHDSRFSPGVKVRLS